MSPPVASPRSRARWLGVDQLEAEELLRLVLSGRSGPRDAGGAGVLLAQLRDRDGGGPPDLALLARAEPAELQRDFGVGPRDALRLAAAFALGRRLVRFRRPPRSALRTADRVAHVFGGELAGMRQECFHIVVLDARHAPRGRFEVSRGTLTSSLVHPREVFRPALARGAAAILGLHNHPSGDPEPSADDIAVTRRMIRAGQLLGVPFLDHVVLGAGRHVSLRDRMSWDGADDPDP